MGQLWGLLHDLIQELPGSNVKGGLMRELPGSIVTHQPVCLTSIQQQPG